MKINSTRKKTLVSFSLVIAIGSFLFCAYEDGITGRTLKSSEPGCLCHSETPSQQVSVVIEGPTQLATGQTGNYVVKITGGPLVRGGTNISASSGILLPGDGLQKISSELTHILPKLPQDNEVIFEFSYKAPNDPTTVTLYANGNSVNNSGTENGDAWNFAENKIVVVNSVADLRDYTGSNSFSLEQNFPNPFNPSTSIKFSIENKQQISLKVYDILGNEIETLVNEEKLPGEYDIKFNGNNLPSGIYLYSIISENFIKTRKMILLR